MQSKNLLKIPNFTRRAIQGFPRSWSQLSNREIIELNLMATFVGVLTGYAAIGFRFLIGFLQNTILHDSWDYHLISPIDHVRGEWMFLIVPVGLLISTLITRYFAPEAKGHGVPEVIQAIWRNGGKIRARTVGLKALASGITIASGGSVGREGPIVQIGSAIGSTLGQFFHLRPKLLKTLVGCGSAGAIAATFNTPIAGVIFAIEIIVLEFKTRSFVPLVISSVFATVISRNHLGNEPAFFVPEYHLLSAQELVFYLGLGVLAGIVGVLFIRFLYFGEDLFDNAQVPFWTKPIFAGILLASVGYYYPGMFGVGYETVTDALQQQSHFLLMFGFVFLKIFSTTITLAGGGSGGVFAPSLFIGAMLGGAYGHFVHDLFPEMTANYGAYALVGMAALFSATGRATFTAIVILFEMTLDYSIILPLMFACVTADQVSSLISRDSIYTLKLKRKGFAFKHEISVNIMSITPIRDIMTTALHFGHVKMTLSEMANELLQYEHSLYPVLDDHGRLAGVFPVNKLIRLSAKEPDALAQDHMDEPTTTIDMNEMVEDALKKFGKSRDPRILVVDGSKKKLVGILSPVDLIRLSSRDLENS
ncbi:MAG: chloride channel protein [Bdellovibrionales bacterium]